MNSNRIEARAINYLEDLLLECVHIDFNISKNDKGLSWDGFIFFIL